MPELPNQIGLTNMQNQYDAALRGPVPNPNQLISQMWPQFTPSQRELITAILTRRKVGTGNSQGATDRVMASGTGDTPVSTRPVSTPNLGPQLAPNGLKPIPKGQGGLPQQGLNPQGMAQETRSDFKTGLGYFATPYMGAQSAIQGATGASVGPGKQIDPTTLPLSAQMSPALADLLTRKGNPIQAPPAAIVPQSAGAVAANTKNWDATGANGPSMQPILSVNTGELPDGGRGASYALPGISLSTNPGTQYTSRELVDGEVVDHGMQRVQGPDTAPDVPDKGHWERFADGGILNEVVLGVGQTTGKKYIFGEAGKEWVVPQGKTLAEVKRMSGNNGAYAQGGEIGYDADIRPESGDAAPDPLRINPGAEKNQLVSDALAGPDWMRGMFGVGPGSPQLRGLPAMDELANARVTVSQTSPVYDAWMKAYYPDQSPLPAGPQVGGYYTPGEGYGQPGIHLGTDTTDKREVVAHELLHAAAYEHPAFRADARENYPAMKAAIQKDQSAIEWMNRLHLLGDYNHFSGRDDQAHVFTELAKSVGRGTPMPPNVAAYFAPLLKKSWAQDTVTNSMAKHQSGKDATNAYAEGGEIGYTDPEQPVIPNDNKMGFKSGFNSGVGAVPTRPELAVPRLDLTPSGVRMSLGRQPRRPEEEVPQIDHTPKTGGYAGGPIDQPQRDYGAEQRDRQAAMEQARYQEGLNRQRDATEPGWRQREFDQQNRRAQEEARWQETLDGIRSAGDAPQRPTMEKFADPQTGKDIPGDMSNSGMVFTASPTDPFRADARRNEVHVGSLQAALDRTIDVRGIHPTNNKEQWETGYKQLTPVEKKNAEYWLGTPDPADTPAMYIFRGQADLKNPLRRSTVTSPLLGGTGEPQPAPLRDTGFPTGDPVIELTNSSRSQPRRIGGDGLSPVDSAHYLNEVEDPGSSSYILKNKGEGAFRPAEYAVLTSSQIEQIKRTTRPGTPPRMGKNLELGDIKWQPYTGELPDITKYGK